MILSLPIDKKTAQRAQQLAANRGMTLEELVQSYLEDLILRGAYEEEIEELQSLERDQEDVEV